MGMVAILVKRPKYIYIYDFSLTVIERWPFQDFSIINALEIKFGLAVKRSRSTQIHHLCIPGRAHIPNATFQVPKPIQKKIFKGFLPYMGMAAILDMWALTFLIALLPST